MRARDSLISTRGIAAVAEDLAQLLTRRDDIRKPLVSAEDRLPRSMRWSNAESEGNHLSNGM